MDERRTRKFTLRDALILVASTAVASLAIRLTMPSPSEFAEQLRSVPTGSMQAFVAIRYGLSAIVPCLATLTAAMIVIRLSPPRLRMRLIARQPGAVACAIATTIAAMEAAWLGGLLAIGRRLVIPATFFVVLLHAVGFAVAGAWGTLAMVGRWRPSADWVDRTGRLCGTAWIGLTLVNECSFLLAS